MWVILICLLVKFLWLKTLYRKGDQMAHSFYTIIWTLSNFWATYCKPCEKEMPYMEELYPEYKEKGIEIVAVSLDATELVIHRFIDKYNLTFPIPHDKGFRVGDLYKVGPIPSTFFISPEGEIVEKVEGALTLERLEEYFKQIQP